MSVSVSVCVSTTPGCTAFIWTHTHSLCSTWISLLESEKVMNLLTEFSHDILLGWGVNAGSGGGGWLGSGAPWAVIIWASSCEIRDNYRRNHVVLIQISLHNTGLGQRSASPRCQRHRGSSGMPSEREKKKRKTQEWGWVTLPKRKRGVFAQKRRIGLAKPWLGAITHSQEDCHPWNKFSNKNRGHAS